MEKQLTIWVFISLLWHNIITISPSFVSYLRQVKSCLTDTVRTTVCFDLAYNTGAMLFIYIGKFLLKDWLRFHSLELSLEV